MIPFSRKVIQLLFLISSISVVDAHAHDLQKMEIEKCARLESGFIFGNRITDFDKQYIPGGSLQYSYCLKSGNYMGFGMGAGVNLFKNEGFIPFYLDIIGMVNTNRNAPFMNLQTGYSFGWSKRFETLRSPEFRGGFLIGIGVGKKILFRERFAYYISLSYKHQLASVRYGPEGQVIHAVYLNYNFLVVSFGMMLEQK